MTYTLRIAAAIAAATIALPLAAQQSTPATPPAAPNSLPAVGAADVTTLSAKVEAIDPVNHTVTVKGSMGHVVTLNVDPKVVKNFAQIKVGDQITLKYLEALSIKLEKGGPGRSATVATTGPITAAPGAKPGVAAEQQTVIIADVEGVDPTRGEVLLRGPAGRYAEVKVKDNTVFNEIKAGDKVKVTYTEALVVDVSPPAAAAK